MLTVGDELRKVLKNKYNLSISEKERFKLIFDYDGNIPPASTIFMMKSGGTILFKTSYGIFHQSKLSYNEILVVLLEQLSGVLSSLRHDLIISALTYPNTKSRREISCRPSI